MWLPFWRHECALLQLLLQANNLDEYIDNTLTQPFKCRDGDTDVMDEAGNKVIVDKTMVTKYQVWKAGNASALKAIRDNIADAITVAAIDSLSTAVDAWSSICAAYVGKGFMLQAKSADDFYLLKYKDFNNVNKFISEFKVRMQCAIEMRVDPKYSHTWCILFINRLSQAFPVWAERHRSIQNQQGDDMEPAKKLSLETLINEVRDEARAKAASHPSNANGLYGGKPPPGGGRGRGNGGAGGAGNAGGKPSKQQCKHCNKTHLMSNKDDCWETFPEKKEAYIKRKEAAEKRRTEKGGQRQGDKAATTPPPPPIGLYSVSFDDLPTVTRRELSVVPEFGQIDDRTDAGGSPAINQEAANDLTETVRLGPIGQLAAIEASQTDRSPATALTTQSGFSNRHLWCPDTGATHHITNDRDCFYSYQESNQIQEVITGGGGVKPEGYGDVVIRAKVADD
jgi:hypothetical protein